MEELIGIGVAKLLQGSMTMKVRLAYRLLLVEVDRRFMLGSQIECLGDGLAHFFQDVPDQSNGSRGHCQTATDFPRDAHFGRNGSHRAGDVQRQRTPRLLRRLLGDRLHQ
jgi:hypothetical protein